MKSILTQFTHVSRPQLDNSKQTWLTSGGSPVPSRAANASPAEKRLGEVYDGGGDNVLVVLEDAQATHVLAPCSSDTARRGLVGITFVWRTRQVFVL